MAVSSLLGLSFGGLFWLAVFCEALLRRRCERRCWGALIVIGRVRQTVSCWKQGQGCCWIYEFLVKFGGQCCSVAEFSLGLAEIWELDLSFI